MNQKMDDIEIKVEPDDLQGVVAVGSYLIDAARRIGAHVPSECERTGACNSCRVLVTKGSEILSTPTEAEISILTAEKIKSGERLSCQVKIVAPGEIVIMREAQQKQSVSDENIFDKFRREFYDMPLEKKIASLVELEAITLGETIAFVLNSPFKLFDLLIDAMAEFGMKLERSANQQKKPPEHREDKSDESDSPSEEKPKDA